MKFSLLTYSAISIFTLSAPAALGAGKITVRTDGNGDFMLSPLGTASWSGDGTVGSNITGTESIATIVSGTMGGTFSAGNFAINAADPATYINGDKSNTGIGLDITIAATGAGATFNFGGRSLDSSSGLTGWQNFQITNMVGVESLSVTYSFSDPIASVRGDGSPAPYLVGMRRAAGAGNYNATGTIENLTVDGDPYVKAFHPSATFVELGIAVWDDDTGVGSITGGSTSAVFNGFTRLDIDGGGVITPTLTSVNDGIVDEIERTYATGMTWTITNASPGAFASGSEFYFSFNGVQYADTYLTVVPEPSAVIVSMLGLGFAIGYRKRS